MARRLLWATLALAPITLVVDRVAHPGDTTLFVMAALALVPLAWLIGEATEHAGEHTGPRIGGLLNASFGNAPEVIIAIFAVADNLPDVVRGSMAGSVIGNILQDEKIPGVHVAFGHPYSEHTGADWFSKTHIDCVGRDFDIWFDGEQVMKNGKFLV